MRRVAITVLAVMMLLVACGSEPEPTSSTAEPLATTTTAGPGTTSSTTATTVPEPTTTTLAPTTTSSTTTTTTKPTTTTSSTTTTIVPAGATQVVIYLMMDDVGETTVAGPTLVPVLRDIDRTVGVAGAAMQALLKGPTSGEADSVPGLSTAIPTDSEFLGVRIEDGIATVNLSHEFETGGGTFSMSARLAQVVYTLTRFPTIEAVSFELDGEPVTVFSSEGLIIDHPLTREDGQSLLPAIFVDRPVHGGTLTNPARITGEANVFEAMFWVTIVDNDGLILAEEPVMASCGTGCWGTFDVTIPYEVDEAQLGAVIVWAASPRDGSQIDVREYPVMLTP